MSGTLKVGTSFDLTSMKDKFHHVQFYILSTSLLSEMFFLQIYLQACSFLFSPLTMSLIEKSLLLVQPCCVCVCVCVNRAFDVVSSKAIAKSQIM